MKLKKKEEGGGRREEGGGRIHSFMPAARAVCLYSSRALPESPIISTGALAT